MIRRLCLLLALAVLGGCAVQSPVTTSAPPSASSTGAEPALVVGHDGTALGEVLAELQARALSARGVVATTQLAPAELDASIAKLTAGDLAVFPVFARTAATTLELGELPESTPDLVADLADALAGEAALMQPSGVSNEPRFLITEEFSQARGVRSLADLAALKQPITVAAPTGFDAAPEGSAGMKALYQVTPRFEVVAEPGARLARLTEGASVAVLRATESQVTAPGLVALTDPQGLVQPDPLVVLLSPPLAEDQTVVLTLKDLDDKLSNAEAVALVSRAATIGAGPAADEWLQAKGVR